MFIRSEEELISGSTVGMGHYYYRVRTKWFAFGIPFLTFIKVVVIK